MKKRILSYLRKSEGYLSGEEISRTLRISRAGVWKNINELRKCGYEIVAVPHLGYRLLSGPDKLFPGEIQNALETDIFGKDIIYRDTVSSTMEEAFRLGIDGAREGTVICAENQSNGRGRLGRSWVSPKGKGIYLSIILRPQLTPSEVARLTLLSGIVVCEAVKKATDVDVKIKWPNDIMVDNRKCAGILTELRAEMDRVNFVVVGIGINVNTPASSLPAGATSLKIEAGKHFSRIAIVQEILESFEGWYRTFQIQNFSVTVKRWKQLSATLGKRIRVARPNGSVEGKAKDLDQHGRLLVCQDNGVVVKVVSGDVEALD